MDKSKIYLARFKDSDVLKTKQDILKRLFSEKKLNSVISKGDMTAVKVHFGEDGNVTYLKSHYISPIVEEVKISGAKPFVSDTNVLYKSKRDNLYDHLFLAKEHGFTMDSLGAPIVIADGIIGKNEVQIEINAPKNKVVNLASEFVSANSIVVITHVTGHLLTGLGATIKNLGMGMASRKGKLIQHCVSKPFINSQICIECGLCCDWCPEDAIIKGTNSYAIDNDKCIGCGECLAQCRTDAVGFKWDTTSAKLQEQVAEHALGIVKNKPGKIVYLTFLINMTKDCDCLKSSEKFVHEDIGVLAGFDPVAIDQAVLDLTGSCDDNVAKKSYPSHDPTVQLIYGEKIGLGTRDYELIEFR